MTLMHSLFNHLKGKGSHARLLFVDFSSAFNIIQPHILVSRLLEQFKLSNNLMGWVLDFFVVFNLYGPILCCPGLGIYL